MVLMAKGMGGVPVEAAVNRFCHIALVEIDDIRVGTDVAPQALKLCKTSSTRAYLVTGDVNLEEVLGEDWEVARVGGIEDQWEKIRTKEGLFFVSVSVCALPETELESGSAFRVSTQYDGKVLHPAKAETVIMLFRTGGLKRLPRPEMSSPYVRDCWVALTALLAASRRGRELRLGKTWSSESFHLSTAGEVVSEILSEIRAKVRVVTRMDEDGLSALERDVQSIVSGLERQMKTEPVDGSVASLVDAILGERIYATDDEDAARLRYLRLWQALTDAAGVKSLAPARDTGASPASGQGRPKRGIAIDGEYDLSRFDEIRNRISHPAGLPEGTKIVRVVNELREAALVWVRELQCDGGNDTV